MKTGKTYAGRSCIRRRKSGRNKSSFLLRAMVCTCLSFHLLNVHAQFRLTSRGAMAALNNIPVPVASMAQPRLSNNSIIAAVPSLTKPFTRGMVVQIPDRNFNDRDLVFAYHSPLAWWSGIFDYRTAAQNMSLSWDGTAQGMNRFMLATIGAAYILDGNNFTMLQQYPQRKTTMIVRANNPVPVHFPKSYILNNGEISPSLYFPSVTSFYTEVPLNFP